MDALTTLRSGPVPASTRRSVASGSALGRSISVKSRCPGPGDAGGGAGALLTPMCATPSVFAEPDVCPVLGSLLHRLDTHHFLASHKGRGFLVASATVRKMPAKPWQVPARSPNLDATWGSKHQNWHQIRISIQQAWAATRTYHTAFVGWCTAEKSAREGQPWSRSSYSSTAGSRRWYRKADGGAQPCRPDRLLLPRQRDP